MSRHSLSRPSPSRHSLADDAPDAPRIAVPRPRTPSDSRHAADVPGATTDAPAASSPPAGTGRHSLLDAPADEPVTVPVPAVRSEQAGGQATAELPTVRDAPAGRRHAAPQRHLRPAVSRADEAPRPARGRRPLVGIGRRPRAAGVLLAAVVALVALPTVGSASVDQCRWQVAAHDLLVSLDGRTDHRSEQLRRALTRAGVGPELPVGCAASAAAPASTGPTATPAPTTAQRPARTVPPTSSATTAPATSAVRPGTTAPKPRTSAPAPAAAAPGTGTTAAATQGWGTPVKSDDFTGGLGQWGIYDGSGHAGNGRRTPSAVTTANGIMTMTGDTGGDTGGMAWGTGQKYGRWEARVRSTAGSYHPVMLLWPDAENWPVGGEVDWMEISDSTRQVADTFLHYGASNDQVQGDVNVDATQWHNWAVEWTPQGITTYLDGKAWWSTRNTSILPPGPMHMTIQLDNFGGPNTATQMQVDWVKQYTP